jgi:pimeloyl-ACP methyl ester carboxylesterase
MKEFILNRKNQKICVVINLVDNPTGLAFVMHGLSGNKEQAHIQAIAISFSDNNYSVVLFDTANTFGESDGKFENATLTNYYEDLEDVISWSKTQQWYLEPFALAGHSLGGYSVAWYAENNPQEISFIVPVSPVVSGKLSADAHIKYEPEEFKLWKETGWREDVSSTRPDIAKKLPWSHMEDRLTHDLFPKVKNLTMPSLVIVGENDTSTPVEHVQIFNDQIPEPKQFHIIKNAPHTFRSQSDLKELTDTISNFIKSYGR